MKFSAKLFSLAGLAVIAMLAGVWLFGGWIVMLILGGFHHSVWSSVPALGYWPSVLVYIAIAFVTGHVRGGVTKV